mmetsp:Transcript_16718/g.31706  ORF Transcript_16718/g.31706 Transcript_16718/m.31706 type:complete len:187 (-) Transcript_16718:142-702(-)
MATKKNFRETYHEGDKCTRNRSSNDVEESLLHLLSVLVCNGFGLWDPNKNDRPVGRAIIPDASFFNHSCDPNVTPEWKDGCVVFKTKREVKCDTELCIAYINVDSRTCTKSRQFELQETYHFMCRCNRCITETNGKKASPQKPKSKFESLSALKNRSTRFKPKPRKARHNNNKRKSKHRQGVSSST